MQIHHITIRNILGIEHLEFSPEGFTAITGQNGQGKTSVLEAIKSAIGQGHDATLLRHGAEKGEVVLVLSDGAEIRERITPNGTTRDVVRDGKKVPSPSGAIKALTDALSVNPVEFLTARRQDRVKVLLESMPISLDAARLEQISGVPVEAGSAHPLHVIEAVRKTVYDDRTGTNRAIKEKAATINQMRAATPDAPGGVEGDEDSIRAEIAAAHGKMQAEQQRIDTKLGSMRSEASDRVTALKESAQAKIDQIKAELAEAISKENSEFETMREKAGRVRQKAADTYQAEYARLQPALQAILTNRDAAAKRKVALETVERMAEELAELEGAACQQDAAIQAIDDYKVELLGALPIQGLEVRDGEVFRDGLPFDRLNTAQRVRIAFDIAKLRAGELPVICLDGMELLDEESLEAVRQQAAEAEVQVFVTRVQPGKFNVETA